VSEHERARFPRRRRVVLALRWAVIACACLLLAVVAVAWWGSRMPDLYSVEEMGVHDFGGGPGAAAGGLAAAAAGAHAGHGGTPASAAAPASSVVEPAAAAATTSVADLVDDPQRPADVRVELVARVSGRPLPDSAPFAGYTLNGSTPGPTIRARLGQLVEVVLENADVPDGVTLHWHGVDVPGAMDGVAGVTQDAVMPGGSLAYRFVVRQTGTFWYHSHQVSHSQVVGGLFGALVLEPAGGPRTGGGGVSASPVTETDAVLLSHLYPGGVATIDGVEGESRAPAPPGSSVRVRVVNTDNMTLPVWVAPAPFRVLAIDGSDVVEPGELQDVRVVVPAGGRVDLEVVVPASGAVRVQLPAASLVVGPDGSAAPTVPAPTGEFDPLSYGAPAPLPFDASHPDRAFRYDIGRLPGFLNGMPGFWWSINGQIIPHVPMYMVAEGDVVVMTVTNASGDYHPMHLHGHHAVVLARNGEAVTGSPWWIDSLGVAQGDEYVIAFVADNPGIWMDHCHNLPHAAEGLMTHLAYIGVTTPYRLGGASGNEPE